jgi:hypothetical protein
MNRRYLFGLLVLLIAIAVSGLTCKKVTDPQSDSSLSSLYGNYAPPFDPASIPDIAACQAACNDYYSDLRFEELERHQQAMKECGSDRECKAAEIALFQDNMEAINAARLQCIRECHDQGETGGGF